MTMEWEDVDPIVKVVPRVQAATYVNKDGKVRIRMFFSDTMLKECGEPKKANIQTGVDGDKLMIRLTWIASGKFSVSDLGRGGARILNIPCKAPGPDGARESEPCEVTHKDKASAIVILPLDAWKKQLDTNTPARQPARQVAASVPLASKNIVEAVPYLRAKGVRIAKMSGDWWQIDGAKASRLDVLARINEHRRHADLKPLSVDQIE